MGLYADCLAATAALVVVDARGRSGSSAIGHRDEAEKQNTKDQSLAEC